MWIKQVITSVAITANLVLCHADSFASNTYSNTGAEQAGMGQSVIMLPVLGLTQNQAAFGWAGASFLELYSQQQPGLPGLSIYSAQYNIPFLTGGLGLQMQRFGNDVYSENKLGLGYGKQLGEHLSSGIQFNYIYTRLKSPYKSYHGLVAEAGVQAKFDKWYFGAHIYNPTLSKTYKSEEEVPETIMRFGAGIQINKTFIFTFEAEKQLDVQPNFKMGLHYRFENGLNFQTGIQSALCQFSAGAGFALKNFSIHMAVTTNQYLNPATHISLKYLF